ncbi:hypothetical protein BVI434_360069 [Burkholderia vietnamiensis]|nr:hypothetical protein BVI434_360069 [Burkholderia vietnamiensis]
MAVPLVGGRAPHRVARMKRRVVMRARLVGGGPRSAAIARAAGIDAAGRALPARCPHSPRD